MRRLKRIVIAVSILCIIIPVPTFAGFDDILKEVLIDSTRPIGANEYVFSPGDQIIQKSSYLVYYSGYEIDQGVKTIIFTIFEDSKSFIVKYPSPDVIKIKDVKMKILSIDNTALRIQLLQQ